MGIKIKQENNKGLVYNSVSGKKMIKKEKWF